MTEPQYKIRIERDGIWPTSWYWHVHAVHPAPWSSRSGFTFTKERARRKAVRAMRSMQRDDVTVVL